MNTRTDQHLNSDYSVSTISDIIKKTGLSLPGFSTRYNIPVRTLQDWKGGIRVPPAYVLELLDFRVSFDENIITERTEGQRISGFAYSFCSMGSEYHGSFSTEDDAFDAAVSEAGKADDRPPFLISMFHKLPIRWNTTGEDIADEIASNLAAEYGSECTDELATEEEIKQLDKSLHRCIDEWTKRFNIGAGYDLISWTRRYIWDEDTQSYIEDPDFYE
jgi:DNA-binding transcriptional regulator YiaG